MKKLEGKVTAENVFAFLQGHIIYLLYYSMFNFLIPSHIKEQIDVRISSMNPECYFTGSCIRCGCKTTQLQMAFKHCEAYCYPSFLSRKLWKKIKHGETIYRSSHLWKIENGVFTKKEVE